MRAFAGPTLREDSGQNLPKGAPPINLHVAQYRAKPFFRTKPCNVRALVDPLYSGEAQVAQQSEVGSGAYADVKDLRVRRQTKSFDQL